MKRKPVKKPAPIKKKTAARAPSAKRISQERRLRPLLRRIAFFSLLGLAFVLTLAGIWAWREGYVHETYYRVHAGIHNTLERVSLAAGMQLLSVEIEGHRVLSKEQVLAATGLNPRRRYGLLGISVEEVRQRVEQLEFVKRAEVQKRFPDTLVIRVVEREPVAFWQHEGQVALIDSEGVVLTPPALRPFVGLPVMVGENAAFHAKALLDFLITEPTLFARVRGMSLIEDRRWNILLEHGTIIKLPEQNPEAAWATLARLQQQRKLLEKAVKMIDLRLPDKVYILPQTVPEAAPEQ